MNVTINLKTLGEPGTASEDTLGLITDIAYMLEKGISFEQDYEQAFKLYSLCAGYGDKTALNNLGWMQLNAFGTKKNISAAIESFEAAAKKGSDLAMVNLGNIYEDPEYTGGEDFTDYKKALHWYKRAADNGFVKAIFNYANMLHHGKGVRKNYKKAFEYFSMISKYDPKTFFYLGLYHENGFGVKKDLARAFHYYTLGTQYDDANCYTHLARMYALGLHVNKSEWVAFELYKTAAELGDSLALTNLGYCYEVGQGVNADMEKALAYYRMAADAGEGHAIEELKRLEGLS